MEVAAFPGIYCHNILLLVVNVIDRSGNSFTLFKSNSANHGGWAKVKLVDVELVLNLGVEFEVGLPNSLIVDIDNVVIIYPLWFGSIAVANKAKLVRPHFPHLGSIQFNICLPVWLPNFICNYMVPKFILNIVSIKIEILVESCLQPAYHRSIIPPSDNCTIICPMLSITIKNIHRLWILRKWQFKISQPECFVSPCPILHNADHLHLRERKNLAAVSIWNNIIEGNVNSFMGLQIPIKNSIGGGDKA